MKKLEAGGKVSVGEMSRLRVRYFTNGMVIGGAGVCGKNCLSGIEEGLERSGRVERGRSGGVKEGSARRGT